MVANTLTMSIVFVLFKKSIKNVQRSIDIPFHSQEAKFLVLYSNILHFGFVFLQKMFFSKATG